MSLILATEGCCKGHPCDNCKTCQSGRCCRKDNPDYKLPELGEWDGPIYGELGVLNDDGEKVECHCCGEWFVVLGSHVWQAHNLTAKEYKSIFGLALSRSLLTDAIRTQQRELLEPRLAQFIAQGQAASPVTQFTPEQRSAFYRRGLNVSTSFRHPSATQFQKGHSLTDPSSKQGISPKTKRSSSYIGISPYRGSGRWKAVVMLRGQQFYLGSFQTEEEAARAYDAKARELYGNKARLNFPDA